MGLNTQPTTALVGDNYTLTANRIYYQQLQFIPAFKTPGILATKS